MGYAKLQQWAAATPLLATMLGIVVSAASAEQHSMTETERSARIKQLQRQKTAVEQELRQLQARPEGTALSTVPRSDLENQPTRNQKESLESVPGVVVQPGGNARMQEFTIR